MTKTVGKNAMGQARSRVCKRLPATARASQAPGAAGSPRGARGRSLPEVPPREQLRVLGKGRRAAGEAPCVMQLAPLAAWEARV